MEALFDSLEGYSAHLRELLAKPETFFLHKNNFPSAKGRGADLLELSVHEIEKVPSGRENSGKLQSLWKNKTGKQSWVVAVRKKKNYSNKLHQTSLTRKDIFKKILSTHVK